MAEQQQQPAPAERGSDESAGDCPSPKRQRREDEDSGPQSQPCPCAVATNTADGEAPLLEVVMERAGQNQSRAADWLGLNRNTLRKKLIEHQLID